jgi:Rrf2 family cysteine metabolism transcriptional repressor
MPITTRSEYGMRAMLLLASEPDGQRMSATELAERARIPRKYLEQILRDLKSAGLIRSYAGVQGGYQLTRPTTEITAGEVVRSLDQMNIMGCVGAASEPSCDQLLGCSLRPLWQRLYAAMHEVLDSTTLQQLTESSCITGSAGAIALTPPESPQVR